MFFFALIFNQLITTNKKNNKKNQSIVVYIKNGCTFAYTKNAITMKTTIENIEKSNDSFVKHIVYVANNSKNETELRNKVTRMFNVFESSENYIFGFGGSHMWVSDKQTGKRILITIFA